jgi:hypothetical protein
LDALDVENVFTGFDPWTELQVVGSNLERILGSTGFLASAGIVTLLSKAVQIGFGQIAARAGWLEPYCDGDIGFALF